MGNGIYGGKGTYTQTHTRLGLSEALYKSRTLLITLCDIQKVILYVQHVSKILGQTLGASSPTKMKKHGLQTLTIRYTTEQRVDLYHLDCYVCGHSKT
jgi:hypothetical protein